MVSRPSEAGIRYHVGLAGPGGRPCRSLDTSRIRGCGRVIADVFRFPSYTPVPFHGPELRRCRRYRSKHWAWRIDGWDTFGFLRSLNLTDAPIRGLIDCVAVTVFR